MICRLKQRKQFNLRHQRDFLSFFGRTPFSHSSVPRQLDTVRRGEGSVGTADAAPRPDVS